jgi:hypothetical protein
VLPSNEGRGYVLRRIMRRAMRHAHILGAKDPLLYRLVPPLVAEMGHAYPELERGTSLIEETLKLEETRFRETLERGLKLLDDAVKGVKRGDTLPGAVAFKLYDTYGFPYDLTEDALKAKGIAVDAQGFAAAMERQREEARRSWAGSGEAATDKLWFELKEELGATEFLGYENEAASGEIVALIKDGTCRLRSKQVSAASSSSTRPRSTPSRAARSATAARLRPRTRASTSRIRRRSCTASIFMSAPWRAARSKSEIRPSSRSTMRDEPPRARITRRRICCTRRSAACSASMWRRRDRWSSPGACASTSPIRSR